MANVSDIRVRMQEALWQEGREQGRRFLTRWCQLVMEAERDVFLGCGRHERSADRRGYRNGYERRQLETSYGRLGLRVPRVRGAGRPLRTRLFDLYQRRHREVETAVEAWVAAGCSTRAVGNSGDTIRFFHRFRGRPGRPGRTPRPTSRSTRSRNRLFPSGRPVRP